MAARAARAAKVTKTKPVVVARSRDASVRSSVQVGSRDASKRRAGVRGAVTKRDGQRTRSGDASKPADLHRGKLCVVYIRQSTYVQVERNRESTARQYDLAARAAELGWPEDAVLVIDEDLGLSGSGTAQRAGFARLAAEVGLGHVGLILSLEASRLARSNADWYRLLDLCAMTGTLIADVDGIYDPADYSDRLSLGLKGTIAESELHVLKARLHGGIRNKAAR